MLVHLALDYDGANHRLHKEMWGHALGVCNYQKSDAANADLIVQWGVSYQNNLPTRGKKPVLILDFPYWNRRSRNTDEFYKVSLNGQHPTNYVMHENHDSTRYFETGGGEIKPWSDGGDFILLAGMGIKAARQNGYELGEWEEKAFKIIKSQTDKPVIYRPKPGRGAPRIHGTIYDDGTQSIEKALEGAYCLVCHHGNPTVTALQMGIPIYMNGFIGAASHLARHDLSDIHNHFKPDNRQQFLNNLAHWQFSIDEIKSGYVIQSFRKRGLI
jgi:hypothetical protein